jgi:hypothetical protein
MSDGSKIRGKRRNARRIAPAIDFGHELANLFDLSHKIAFLPGGYGGIGEAIAWVWRNAAQPSRSRAAARPRPTRWRASSAARDMSPPGSRWMRPGSPTSSR